MHIDKHLFKYPFVYTSHFASYYTMNIDYSIMPWFSFDKVIDLRFIHNILKEFVKGTIP